MIGSARRRLLAVLTAILGLCLCLAMPARAWAAPASATAASSTARIHVLSFGFTDAILLESDGRFGLVDAGEDDDYPSGADPRYPLREDITRGGGVTDKLFAYMRAMGVTSENFEFLVCTHPHSDHIGGADEVIEEFKPQRVYLLPYKDSYIFEPSRLWDNQYVYDRTVEAALANGATLIQGFDTSAPVDPGRLEEAPEDPAPVDPADPIDPADPEKPAQPDTPDPSQQTTDTPGTPAASEPSAAEKDVSAPVAGDPVVLDAQEMVEAVAPQAAPETVQEDQAAGAPKPQAISPAPEGAKGSYVGNPQFKLGSMNISIYNYDTDYFTHPKYDANEFSLGVLVEANSHKAFLAGDIGNLDGDEDRLAKTLGKVDLLKLGHHGLEGSNSRRYLNSLAPRTLVMTSELSSAVPSQAVLDYTKDSETRLIDAVHQAELNRAATVADFSYGKVAYNVPETKEVRYLWREKSPHYMRFEDGYLKKVTEWNNASWGDWYHFDRSPYAQEGTWYREGTHFFYLKPDGAMAKDGVVTVDGKTYLFDGEGHMMSLPQGWSFAEGAWRYGVSDGTVKTGWLNEHGTWYYLDPKTGAMAQGWAQVDSAWYYFAPGSGAMRTGWLDQGGAWYYLQGSGARAQGWLFDRGSWYYLIPGSGAMARGWAQIGNTWYYLSGSGAMVTGWLNLGGTWYYLAPGSGAMVTGWLKLGGTWYYLTSSGAMARGWVQVDNTWYYLRGSGAMATGWIQVGGTWYYLTGSGAMATGWIKLGATWYYLTPGSGAMVTGSHVIDGTQYSFNGSGAWVA